MMKFRSISGLLIVSLISSGFFQSVAPRSETSSQTSNRAGTEYHAAPAVSSPAQSESNWSVELSSVTTLPPPSKMLVGANENRNKQQAWHLQNTNLAHLQDHLFDDSPRDIPNTQYMHKSPSSTGPSYQTGPLNYHDTPNQTAASNSSNRNQQHSSGHHNLNDLNIINSRWIPTSKYALPDYAAHSHWQNQDTDHYWASINEHLGASPDKKATFASPIDLASSAWRATSTSPSGYSSDLYGRLFAPVPDAMLPQSVVSPKQTDHITLESLATYLKSPQQVAAAAAVTKGVPLPLSGTNLISSELMQKALAISESLPQLNNRNRLFATNQDISLKQQKQLKGPAVSPKLRNHLGMKAALGTKRNKSSGGASASVIDYLTFDVANPNQRASRIRDEYHLGAEQLQSVFRGQQLPVALGGDMMLSGDLARLATSQSLASGSQPVAMFESPSLARHQYHTGGTNIPTLLAPDAAEGRSSKLDPFGDDSQPALSASSSPSDNLFGSSHKYLTHHSLGATPIYLGAYSPPHTLFGGHAKVVSRHGAHDKAILQPVLIGIAAALISFLILSNLFLSIPLFAMTLFQLFNGNMMLVPSGTSSNMVPPNSNGNNNNTPNQNPNGGQQSNGKRRRRRSSSDKLSMVADEEQERIIKAIEEFADYQLNY